MKSWKLLHKQLQQRVLRHKRELEIGLVIDNLRPYLCRHVHKLRILEFGAGSCYQAERLSVLGSVTSTDLNLGPPCRNVQEGVKLVVCVIEQAPFQSNSFDLVYSNHVLEHLADLKAALSDARRIGKIDALFAFTLPTRLWLLLAQPVVLLGKIVGLWRSWRREGFMALARLFTLGGHGVYQSFAAAFKAFAVSNWTRVFEIHGFQVLECRPLLLYAPSELLLPPSRKLVRLGLCSSMLFMLRATEKSEDA